MKIRTSLRSIAVAAVVLALAACASMPAGRPVDAMRTGLLAADAGIFAYEVSGKADPDMLAKLHAARDVAGAAFDRVKVAANDPSATGLELTLAAAEGALTELESIVASTQPAH